MRIAKVVLITLILLPNSVLSQQVDSVKVTFKVIVPDDTPEDANIFWAGSLNRWDPGPFGSGFGAQDFSRPLEKENGLWKVSISAPKGTKVSWKYTRGSIFSVEEKIDYTYRPIRSIIFNTSTTVRDTVETWHDIPPSSLDNNWPFIQLKSTDLKIQSSGQKMPGFGTILYDENLGSNVYSFNESNTTVHEDIDDEQIINYFIPVLDAPQNTILVSAIKKQSDKPWKIYIDQNNSRTLSESKHILTIGTGKDVWSGRVAFQNERNQQTFIDSVEVQIRHAKDLPPGYRSTNSEAPNLSFLLPFRHKKGIFNSSEFNITTTYFSKFSEFFWVTVDRNQDEILNIGSGSNEVEMINLGKMRRSESYYLHPSFELNGSWWEVADIDPYGDWVRLRPSNNFDDRKSISIASEIPRWEATTIEGKITGSQKLSGKYVLMDFWGSWCGPCIDAIPNLKQAYKLYSAKEFEIVGFAYESEASLNNALKRFELPWPQVLDDNGSYSSQFLVKGYPTYYLVDPNGKVVEMGNSLRDEQLMPTLDKYLNPTHSE